MNCVSQKDSFNWKEQNPAEKQRGFRHGLQEL